MHTVEISWLAIWNRELHIARPAKPASPSQDEADDDDNDDSSGLLYMYSADKRESPDAVKRRFGLAQGLVDFTQ